MTTTADNWAQRCADDAEARDWAVEYGRSEFYWSAKWGALTAVADGTTTLTDVADAIAAGTATPYQEALAAHYWLDAAEYLAVGAQAGVSRASWGAVEESLADDQGRIPRLVDDSALAVAELKRDFADAAMAETRRIADAASDREQVARRWAEAEDEAAYHEAGAQVVLAADVAGAWRTAVDVEYDQRCAEYGNDGRPEDDRHISAEDKAAQAAARTGLAPGAVWDAVGGTASRYALSDGTEGATLGQPDWDQVAEVWDEVQAEMAQYRHDAALAAQIAEDPVLAAEEAAIAGSIEAAWGPDAEGADLQAELQEYRGGAAAAEAAREREITGTYRDMGSTAEQIAQAEDGITVEQVQAALDRLADYEATVVPGPDAHNSAPTPAWDEEAHRRDWTPEQRAAADALDDPTGWQSAMAIEVPSWVAEQGGAAVAEYVARVAAETSETEWAPHEDVVAGFESDAAREAEVRSGDAALEAHQQWLAAAAAEGHRGRADPAVWGAVAPDYLAASNRAGWYPQEYSSADDPHDHAFHHGGDADLPPLPAEYTAHIQDQAATALEREDDAMTSPDEPTTARQLDEDYLSFTDLGASGDDADAAAFLHSLMTGPDGPHSEPHVAEELAGALHVELADALDQAQARLAAGDVPEADRAAHEAQIELLEAELAGDEAVPDELVRGGDPVLAAKTAAWMAAEAAATERWLAVEGAGSTAVDSHDGMVERHDTDQQDVVRPDATPWNTPTTADRRDEATTSDDDGTVLTAEKRLGALTPDEAARETSREAQADPSSRELGELFNSPNAEPPGKAGAAEVVGAAHEAVQVDTQRAAEELDALGARAHVDGQAQRTEATEQAPTMEASA